MRYYPIVEIEMVLIQPEKVRILYQLTKDFTNYELGAYLEDAKVS
jgi:hypothetical protein